MPKTIYVVMRSRTDYDTGDTDESPVAAYVTRPRAVARSERLNERNKLGELLLGRDPTGEAFLKGLRNGSSRRSNVVSVHYVLPVKLVNR